MLSLRKSDVTGKYDEYQRIALVQQNIELPNHANGKVNMHSHIQYTYTFIQTSQNQFHMSYLILKLRLLQRNKKPRY